VRAALAAQAEAKVRARFGIACFVCGVLLGFGLGIYVMILVMPVILL
jgi:hypothetical protein